MSLSNAHRRTSFFGSRLLGGLTLLSALAATSAVSAQEPAAAAPEPAAAAPEPAAPSSAKAQPPAKSAPSAKASISTTTTTPATSTAASATGGTKQTSATAPQAKSGKAARDPDGIKGISPYWEAINRGDAEFAAQTFEDAAKEYRAAITTNPKDPVGHLRMTELSIKLGELAQAREFVDSALRYSESIPRQQAQAAFLLAKVAELQGKNDEALAAWAKYRALVPASAGTLPVKIHVSTADARIQAIEARKKMLADYAPVLERITKNVEAADDVTGSGASATTSPSGVSGGAAGSTGAADSTGAAGAK